VIRGGTLPERGATLPSMAAPCPQSTEPMPTAPLAAEKRILSDLSWWWRCQADDRRWNFTQYHDAACTCSHLAATLDRAGPHIVQEFERAFAAASPQVWSAWELARHRLGFAWCPTTSHVYLIGLLKIGASFQRGFQSIKRGPTARLPDSAAAA
jgi:hypothetical protein